MLESPYVRRWYAVINDEVGGWAIATREAPTSDIGPGEGVIWMVDSEKVARYIVELHNFNLSTRKTAIP